MPWNDLKKVLRRGPANQARRTWQQEAQGQCRRLWSAVSLNSSVGSRHGIEGDKIAHSMGPQREFRHRSSMNRRMCPLGHFLPIDDVCFRSDRYQIAELQQRARVAPSGQHGSGVMSRSGKELGLEA
jgi:hypothetical protein